MGAAGRNLVLLGSLLWMGCGQEPVAFPTEVAVQEGLAADEADAAAQTEEPPLFQLLYDAPLQADADGQLQRVRMLVWLRYMELTTEQLARLDELRLLAEDRRARIREAEATLRARVQGEERRIYEATWAALARGAPADAPELVELSAQLATLREGGGEAELLRIRVEGIRSILEAERPFLASLTPRQEALVTDSLFLLRHRLDPVANPGDFRELVGTTYEPGQYAVLTRGTGEVARDPLDIGALWADKATLEQHALHSARREVLLYLALMEPGLAEAIDAAAALAGEGQPEISPGR